MIFFALSNREFSLKMDGAEKGDGQGKRLKISQMGTVLYFFTFFYIMGYDTSKNNL